MSRATSERSNHEPVVDQLAEVWASVTAACRDVSEEEWVRLTACPGWTVKDQLSHLIGTERMLLDDPPPPQLAEVPPHVKNPLGAANEAWIERRRDLPGDDVLFEFVETTRRRLEALRSMAPDAFDTLGWSPEGEAPYRRFMETRVLDSWAHEQDIRQALGRPGGRGGAGETVTLQRCEQTMPYVVGKRVAPPDGTVVLFAVRGPLGRDITVVVEGDRARLSPAPVEADPSVVVELDDDAFWRLCFGRTTGVTMEADGQARLSGDTALGEAVLGAMAFMI